MNYDSDNNNKALTKKKVAQNNAAQVYKLGPMIDPPLPSIDNSLKLPGASEDNTMSNKLNIVHDPELLIHHIDVYQGEATLIEYKVYGERALVVLIDGGHETRGGGTFIRHLKSFGITKVDALICTHYDADHIEGLTRLLAYQDKEGITVEHVFDRSSFARGNRKNINNFRVAAGDKRKQLKVGDQIVPTTDIHPQLSLTCLYVDADASTEGEENNAGIAMLIKFGNFIYYTGGDLESIVEDDLIEKVKGTSHLCAFKCGHHGSKHSTSKNFVAQTSPRVAFISCGKHSYAHPDDPVIENLCGSDTMQKFYLTNCCYNRAGVNPNFHKDEIRIAAAAATQLVIEAEDAVEEAKNLVAAAKKISGVAQDDETTKNAFILQAEAFQKEAEETLKAAREGERLAGIVTDETDTDDIDNATKAAGVTLDAAKKAIATLDKIKEAFSKVVREKQAGFAAISMTEGVIEKTLKQAKYVRKCADSAVDSAALAEKLRDENNARKLKGFVAGDKAHLGTILLHVRGSHAAKDKHSFHVGFWDSFYWDLKTEDLVPGLFWYAHHCNGEQDVEFPPKGIGDFMSKAVTLTELSNVNMGYSPGRWTTETTATHDGANYYRFWLPTKAAADLPQIEKESKYEYRDAYEEYLQQEDDEEVYDEDDSYSNDSDNEYSHDFASATNTNTLATNRKRRKSSTTDKRSSEQDKRLKVGEKGTALRKSNDDSEQSSSESEPDVDVDNI